MPSHTPPGPRPPGCEPPGPPAPRPAPEAARGEGRVRRRLHDLAPWVDLFFKLSAGIAASLAILRALL